MKRTLFTCIALIISTLYLTQVIPLTIDSETYGYATVGYLGKEGKGNFSYILEIEDNNLNKINEVTFQNDFMATQARIYFNKSTLLIYMLGYGDSNRVTDRYYYLYDLKTNTLSDKNFLPGTYDKKTEFINCYPIEDKGFVVKLTDKKNENIHFVAIDNQNKTKWSTQLNNLDRKNDIHVHSIDSDKDIIATISIDDDKLEKGSYNLFINDANNGKSINKIWLDDENYSYEPNRLIINADKIYLFGDAYNSGKNFNGKTVGVFMITMDKNGNNLSKKVVKWISMARKLNIDEKGWIKNEGYIYTHDFYFNPKDQHIILAGELFKGNPIGVTISDLIFIDFDANFDLVNAEKIEKKKNTFSTGQIKYGTSRKYGKMIDSYGYFNYDFANEIENSNGLAFFYSMYDVGLLKKSTIDYGIVVYKDGKFSQDKVSYERVIFKGAGVVVPNKPGYIMIYEYDKNEGYKKRIEKINH